MAENDSAGQRKPPAFLVKATTPMASRLAGRSWFPLWAQVHHRGRRSGTEYVIPVAVLVKENTFIIGLPWGPNTNWVKNVLAAQGCIIRWKGRDYRMIDPRLVDKAAALEVASGFQRRVIERVAFPGFLRLTRTT